MTGVLQTLISHTFIRYMGCIIEKCEGGYRRRGIFYESLDAAKAAIDESLRGLQNSIR